MNRSIAQETGGRMQGPATGGRPQSGMSPNQGGQRSSQGGAAQGVQGMVQRGQEQVGRALESSQAGISQAVSEYPISITLATFAAGMAVGALLGAWLTEPEPRWYDRVPESMGRRWLESLTESLPSSVRNRMG